MSVSGLSTSHTSPLQEFLPLQSKIAEYYRDHRAILRRVDFEFMATADGRQKGESGRVEFTPSDPQLILQLGGSLAQVKTGLGGAPGGGGLRGDVTGFSTASRRRLMRLIASLERENRPIFVTMTYPDLFPPEKEKWKRDIDTFGKRLARRYPTSGFLWRIEFKERKSGSSAGSIAPHFHMLVYGAGYRDLLDWVPGAWWSVVDSRNEDHLKAGTRVERIHSFGGIMRYVGKYIAKEEAYPEDWKGRVWGVVGRSRLPWAVEVIISLTGEQGIKLVRLGRKMIRAGGKTLNHGLTWVVNAVRVLDYLEFLLDFAEEVNELSVTRLYQ